jgi:hypothetical protein
VLRGIVDFALGLERERVLRGGALAGHGGIQLPSAENPFFLFAKNVKWRGVEHRNGYWTRTTIDNEGSVWSVCDGARQGTGFQSIVRSMNRSFSRGSTFQNILTSSLGTS